MTDDDMLAIARQHIAQHDTARCALGPLCALNVLTGAIRALDREVTVARYAAQLAEQPTARNPMTPRWRAAEAVCLAVDHHRDRMPRDVLAALTAFEEHT